MAAELQTVGYVMTVKSIFFRFNKEFSENLKINLFNLIIFNNIIKIFFLLLIYFYIFKKLY